jgi:hypothetical protein
MNKTCPHCSAPFDPLVCEPSLPKLPMQLQCHKCERAYVGTYRLPDVFSPEPFTHKACAKHMPGLEKLRQLAEQSAEWAS